MFKTLSIILLNATGAFSAALITPRATQLEKDWTCVTNGLEPLSYCCQQAMDVIFYNCGTRLKMPFCIGSKTLKRVCCDKVIDTPKAIIDLPGVESSVKIKNLAGRCDIV